MTNMENEYEKALLMEIGSARYSLRNEISNAQNILINMLSHLDRDGTPGFEIISDQLNLQYARLRSLLIALECHNRMMKTYNPSTGEIVDDIAAILRSCELTAFEASHISDIAKSRVRTVE